ncbi:MAG TPA: nuclear transport factor 2 family protein [Gaiellaceae bacterium]|nr:nuclear transport factor 2 family protein [Gaiellaceae bacterium]
MRGEPTTGMTREEMDALVAEHFRFEATDDVEGVLGTLLTGADHEVIPSPFGALDDPAEQRRYYELLFDSIKGERVEPLRRYYGDDFLVDESLWHGRIEDGRPFLCDGRSGDVSFRLLHVFEFRDGKISREQVWCDLAAIQRQLGVS